MRALKKIILALTFSLALLCVNSRTAWSQVEVHDLASITQNLKAWISEMNSTAEQISKLDTSLTKFKEIVNKNKKLYNEISPWITEGRELYRLGQQIERVNYDFEYLEQYISFMSESGRITPAKVRHIRRTGTYLGEELEEIENKLKEILKSANDLSNAQRDEKIKELNNDVANMCDKVEKDIENEMAEMADAIIGESTTNNLLLAFGMVEDENTEDEMTSEIDEIIAGLNKEERQELYDEESLFDNDTVSSVFGFVTAIIGILAVLMIVWAYGRRVKGEPQHQDAMWKVFAGLIFILLMLQVLKVCLFDSGLVNLR